MQTWRALFSKFYGIMMCRIYYEMFNMKQKL